jgi:hypothetical protein
VARAQRRPADSGAGGVHADRRARLISREPLLIPWQCHSSCCVSESVCAAQSTAKWVSLHHLIQTQATRAVEPLNMSDRPAAYAHRVLQSSAS